MRTNAIDRVRQWLSDDAIAIQIGPLVMEIIGSEQNRFVRPCTSATQLKNLFRLSPAPLSTSLPQLAGALLEEADTGDVWGCAASGRLEEQRRIWLLQIDESAEGEAQRSFNGFRACS
jgi:hypothetical protein